MCQMITENAEERTQRFWQFAKEQNLQEALRFIYGAVDGDRCFRRLQNEFDSKASQRTLDAASPLYSLLATADRQVSENHSGMGDTEREANQIVFYQILEQLHHRLQLLDFVMHESVRQYLYNSIKTYVYPEHKSLPRNGFGGDHFWSVLVQEILTGGLDFHALSSSAEQCLQWLKGNAELLEDRDFTSPQKSSVVRLMKLLSTRLSWRAVDQLRKLSLEARPESDLLQEGSSGLDSLHSGVHANEVAEAYRDLTEEIVHFVTVEKKGTAAEAEILILLIQSQGDNVGKFGETKWQQVLGLEQVQSQFGGVQSSLTSMSDDSDRSVPRTESDEFKNKFKSLISEFRVWHKRRE